MAIPVAKSYGLTVITNGSAANKERVLDLGVDRFIDYKTEDYSEVLSEVDNVRDTLGDRELAKEFSILKHGGKLVSLRSMPNGEFAVRTGMPAFKKLLLKVAGRKHDQMVAKKNQSYYFIFVHEDGAGLERISEIFAERHIEASVDEVFSLDEVNSALQKVAAGKSKGANEKAKANVITAIGELIQISDKKAEFPDYGRRHGNKAKNGWYRYDTRFALPVYGDDESIERYNIFQGHLLIRHASSGKKYLYDVLEIKKETGKSCQT